MNQVLKEWWRSEMFWELLSEYVESLLYVLHKIVIKLQIKI